MTVRKVKPRLLLLKGSIQHYEWGGFEFIPHLLGIQNDDKKPFAELWIGAHPKSPSTTEFSDTVVTLVDLIAGSPDALLGTAAASRFAGRLPYLLKLLDARKMLSIQAHPAKRQAEEGFARENAAGISLNSAHRNYKDDNHKPEVHVALTEFWMLHGFRPLEETARTLRTVPELAPIIPGLAPRLAIAPHDANAHPELLRALYGTVMSMPRQRVDALLNPLIARLEMERPTDKCSPDYWALRAAEDFPLPDGHRDRGIFSIYLLNLLRLQPGQGTFQPAGVLHAYLEGVNVELMANSDNVLRGGLTPKHIDVEELMRALSFESGLPAVLSGEPVSPTESVYRTPAAEFELSRIEIGPGNSHVGKTAWGPDSIIVLGGSATVACEDRTLSLNRGDILFAPQGIIYTIQTARESITLYKASLPAPKA